VSDLNNNDVNNVKVLYCLYFSYVWAGLDRNCQKSEPIEQFSDLVDVQ
jgi:hypothetical protein